MQNSDILLLLDQSIAYLALAAPDHLLESFNLNRDDLKRILDRIGVLQEEGREYGSFLFSENELALIKKVINYWLKDIADHQGGGDFCSVTGYQEKDLLELQKSM